MHSDDECIIGDSLIESLNAFRIVLLVFEASGFYALNIIFVEGTVGYYDAVKRLAQRFSSKAMYGIMML